MSLYRAINNNKTFIQFHLLSGNSICEVSACALIDMKYHLTVYSAILLGERITSPRDHARSVTLGVYTAALGAKPSVIEAVAV